MNTKHLKIQHRILKILEEQYFKFYNNSSTEHFNLQLQVDEISKILNVKPELTLKLLTNLTSRNLIKRTDGDLNSYFILQPGITAHREELLLEDAKKVGFDKFKSRTDIARNLVFIISLFLSLLLNIYIFISGRGIFADLEQIELRIDSLENKISDHE